MYDTCVDICILQCTHVEVKALFLGVSSLFPFWDLGTECWLLGLHS